MFITPTGVTYTRRRYARARTWRDYIYMYIYIYVCMYVYIYIGVTYPNQADRVKGALCA